MKFLIGMICGLVVAIAVPVAVVVTGRSRRRTVLAEVNTTRA